MTTSTRTETIFANVAALRARIDAAARRGGRNPADVRLIAVSKTFPAEAIAAVLAAGVRDIGENRVQEAEAKRAQLPAGAASSTESGPLPVWHLIGHLQTNKVKTALRVFDILQSIDSIRLAGAVSRQATAPVEVLLEVNVAGEASKFGFAPADVPAAVEQVARLTHLRLIGLMTVAPLVNDPQELRPLFRTMRGLRDATGLTELSMGMSGDFEVAIEEGATMVRVGRALFGERPARDG